MRKLVKTEGKTPKEVMERLGDIPAGSKNKEIMRLYGFEEEKIEKAFKEAEF